MIAIAGEDVHLGAVATGPQTSSSPCSRPRRRSTASPALFAVRSNVVRDPGGLGFGALVELAPSGPNSAPAVAVDPDSDTAIAAWQSGAGIYWARGTPS